MKVAIYIRVSTEEQAKEGFSISAQRNKLEAYCISQGWEVIGFYVDEGISAKDMERPELKRMIKHIENGVIECVLVYRLDRLTRSVLDLYKLLEIFEKHDCKFKSATEVYDTTTAMGRMFITIVAALAQWERENMGERISMGMQEKARQGKWVPSQPPFGYILDRENDTLIIEKEEARIVKMIYNHYIKGNVGITKLAKTLNESHVPNRENKWSDNKIKYILMNPLYIGTMRYNYRLNKENYFEVKDALPPIISKETFEKANSIMSTRNSSHPRTATSRYIFSGVVRCSRCKGPLHGHQSGTKRGEKTYYSFSYICRNKKIGICDLPGISENYLELQFIEKLEAFLIDDDLYEIEEPIDNNDEEIKVLEAELEKIANRKTRWQYAWANQMLSDDDFVKRTEEETKKEEIAKEELSKIKKIETNYQMSPHEMKVLLKDTLNNWNNLEVQEKKNLITFLVKSMTVDKEVVFARTPNAITIKGIEYH